MLLGCAAACGAGGDRDGPLWGDQPAGELDLRAELSATEVPLLAEVELRLDLYVRTGVEVDFDPAVPEGFAGSVEVAEPRSWGDGEWRRYVLQLRPTETGEREIPSFRVEGAGGGPVATSRDFVLQVTSLLGEAGAEVEPPAPPFPVPTDPWPWIGAGLGLLALIALLVWRRRRPRAEAQQPRETPLPPHVKALRALGRLRGAPRSTPEQIEAFYVEVSQILRVYLEERFGLHAPERTTEEFLAEVEAGDALSVEQRSRLTEFLRQCDLVKFARALPGEDIHAATFDTAEQFVEATRADRVREGAA